MNKDQLIKKLKAEFYNDYAVILDSVVHGFKYWIYGNIDIAKREHKRITENSDMLKPCTVELVPLH